MRGVVLIVVLGLEGRGKMSRPDMEAVGACAIGLGFAWGITAAGARRKIKDLGDRHDR